MAGARPHMILGPVIDENQRIIGCNGYHLMRSIGDKTLANDRDCQSYNDCIDLDKDYVLHGLHRFNEPVNKNILVYEDHISLTQWLGENPLEIDGWICPRLKSILRRMFEALIYGVQYLGNQFSIENVVLVEEKPKLTGLFNSNDPYVNYSNVGNGIASLLESIFDTLDHPNIDHNQKADFYFLILTLRMDRMELRYTLKMPMKHPFFMSESDRLEYRHTVYQSLAHRTPIDDRERFIREVNELARNHPKYSPCSWTNMSAWSYVTIFFQDAMDVFSYIPLVGRRLLIMMAPINYDGSCPYSFLQFMTNLACHVEGGNSKTFDHEMNTVWPGVLAMLFHVMLRLRLHTDDE